MRGIGKLKYLDELMRLLETKPDKLRIQIIYIYIFRIIHTLSILIEYSKYLTHRVLQAIPS